MAADLDAHDSRHISQHIKAIAKAVDQLHRTCGVYTLPEVAGRILDQVGWRADADLSNARLLEPAAGAGEFVVQAGIRLVESCRARGIEPRARRLRSRIAAFELHPVAARQARQHVRDALQNHGLHHRTAAACAAAWIRNADFLLSDLPASFTHVVGNPPYIRWSKVPEPLKSLYEAQLPKEAARGDIFLPFLDRSLDLLDTGGKCGILCSDRWLYMAFAERFRAKWLPRLAIASNEPIAAAEAFDRRVEAYPSILIATKRPASPRPGPAVLHARGETLGQLGCTIKAGPALGHTPAFVLEPQADDVEPELLRPWLDSSEIVEGAVRWRGRRVIVPFDAEGKIVDLRQFPKLARRLQRYAPALRKRSIVRKGADWYRTIDRIKATDWKGPKLLVPGLARIPRIALDRSGTIPSHGVYAIFPPCGEADAIHDRLRDGQLAAALQGIAPTLKNGYVRCYKHFLAQIRI